MSNNDPRVIAIALEDLLQEMRSWSVRASQTLAAASHIQRQVREAAERALHHASVLLDEARQDAERVLKVRTTVDSLLAECQSGRDVAADTLAKAEEALSVATATLNYWEHELKKALAWLARAKARLARALAEYERARSAYEQAQWALERAQSRYQSCLNDKNRSNCNSEASDVSAAQDALRSAAYRLQLAEQEVIAAQAEVDAAQARVDCCTNAVDYATQAVGAARVAESAAQQALTAAEQSLEFAQAAERDTLVAEEKVGDEVATAEQMLVVTRSAISTTDEAATHLSTADGAEESAQRYARGAGHELEYKLQLLYQLNLPDLYVSNPGAAFGVGVATTAGQTGTWIDEGIKFVKVADLPEPEGISGQADFRKITESRVRAGIEKLQEMKPLIEGGAGASSDYWADYDKRRGLGYAEGYQQVYDAFYGSDCIKVNNDQDAYDIDNGRHRIWLAKRMGVEQLPMRVVKRRRYE
jgi:exonuclease VII small subunit